MHIYSVYSRWDNILFGTLFFKRKKKIESVVDNLTTDKDQVSRYLFDYK